jgi:hypothetical protein
MVFLSNFQLQLKDNLSSPLFENPNGIPAQSPGLRGTRYPGASSAKYPQPQRGCGQSISIRRATAAITPLGLFSIPQYPQGRHWRADLGLEGTIPLGLPQHGCNRLEVSANYQLIIN